MMSAVGPLADLSSAADGRPLLTLSSPTTECLTESCTDAVSLDRGTGLPPAEFRCVAQLTVSQFNIYCKLVGPC